MHFEARSGHIGGGLSAIDLLAYLFGRWLTPQDRFVLSKGHAASALYATLNHFGLLSHEELKTYYQDGTLLPAHPAAGGHQAIAAATGSLGHGLPVSIGMAYSHLYLLQDETRVACLVSDGECDEGTTWEAALFAAHHRLRNLYVIVDRNHLQGFGGTEDVLSLEPFEKKWASFGFEVRTVDGHDLDSLEKVFAPAPDSPVCIIAGTVKGKGVDFMEGKMEWHYLPMNEQQYAEANKSIDSAMAALANR